MIYVNRAILARCRFGLALALPLGQKFHGMKLTFKEDNTLAASMTNRVLTEAFGAETGAARRVRQAILVVAGIALLAIAAKIRVPMWPVPITMGTFAVLTLAAAYGPRLGLVTILGYMGVGALGFDVFASSAAGLTGIDYMMGSTGGYLAGFVLATLALGALARRGWDRSVFWMALAMLIGNVLIYLPGLAWLITKWSSLAGTGQAQKYGTDYSTVVLK